MNQDTVTTARTSGNATTHLCVCVCTRCGAVGTEPCMDQGIAVIRHAEYTRAPDCVLHSMHAIDGETQESNETTKLADTLFGRLATLIGVSITDPALDRLYAFIQQDRAAERTEALTEAAAAVCSCIPEYLAAHPELQHHPDCYANDIVPLMPSSDTQHAAQDGNVS